MSFYSFNAFLSSFAAVSILSAIPAAAKLSYAWVLSFDVAAFIITNNYTNIQFGNTLNEVNLNQLEDVFIVKPYFAVSESSLKNNPILSASM